MAKRWRWLGEQLFRGLRPHEVALAVAVGAACAFFPVLGLATPLCCLAALALRLNLPLVQAINGLTSPGYPAAVYLFVRIGAWASRNPTPSFGGASFWTLVRHPSPAVLAAIGQGLGLALVGWAVVAAAWIPLAYGATLAAHNLALRRAPGPAGMPLRHAALGNDGRFGRDLRNL